MLDKTKFLPADILYRPITLGEYYIFQDGEWQKHDLFSKGSIADMVLELVKAEEYSRDLLFFVPASLTDQAEPTDSPNAVVAYNLYDTNLTTTGKHQSIEEAVQYNGNLPAQDKVSVDWGEYGFINLQTVLTKSRQVLVYSIVEDGFCVEEYSLIELLWSGAPYVSETVLVKAKQDTSLDRDGYVGISIWEDGNIATHYVETLTELLEKGVFKGDGWLDLADGDENEILLKK